MLRSVFFSVSALLLLSVINIQSAKGQSVLRVLTRVTQVVSAVSKANPTAIASFSATARSKSVLPGLRTAIASHLGNEAIIATAGVGSLLQMIKSHQGNAQLMKDVTGSLAMLDAELEKAFQLEYANAYSTIIGTSDVGREGVRPGYFDVDVQPTAVQQIPVDLQLATGNAQLSPQAAGQMATEKSNFRIVIGAVRDALMKRAADFAMPQFSDLARTLYTHLNTLVDKVHIALLGERAEVCIRGWQGSYNPAVRNMARFLLAVSLDTTTYAAAADQMLNAMHRTFTEPIAALIRRLNTLTSDVCQVYSRRLATAGVAL